MNNNFIVPVVIFLIHHYSFLNFNNCNDLKDSCRGRGKERRLFVEKNQSVVISIYVRVHMYVYYSYKYAKKRMVRPLIFTSIVEWIVYSRRGVDTRCDLSLFVIFPPLFTWDGIMWKVIKRKKMVNCNNLNQYPWTLIIFIFFQSICVAPMSEGSF